MNQAYIPALRFDFLTPVFDPLVSLLIPDRRLRLCLIEAAALSGTQKILDFGSGTAGLALAVKGHYPNARVFGLDVDSRAISIARRKASARGLGITLDRYNGWVFPYASSSFDRVMSSFVFHHLLDQQKRCALDEAMRVLRPGGEIHIADFDRPRNLLIRAAFTVGRLFDGLANTRANALGLLPRFLERAGFQDVEERHRFTTVFGEISLIRGVKPA